MEVGKFTCSLVVTEKTCTSYDVTNFFPSCCKQRSNNQHQKSSPLLFMGIISYYGRKLGQQKNGKFSPSPGHWVHLRVFSASLLQTVLTHMLICSYICFCLIGRDNNWYKVMRRQNNMHVNFSVLYILVRTAPNVDSSHNDAGCWPLHACIQLWGDILICYW